MEDSAVQKLPRKELLLLCTNHNIRTAGVKHDELIRLLQKKLHPPASDTPRATLNPRSQISTNSPVSSPKARNQNSANSPFSSPNTEGKPDKKAAFPTPGSISQGRSLRPLVLVIQDDRSRNNTPEPSPRTSRKDQLSATAGVQPGKPTTTKSNAPPAQRSDLLRKKVNTLTAFSKLQAQERARPVQKGDGSLVRDRNNVVPVSIGKQAQEMRPKQSDRGASVRSRSGAPAVGAPKKNIKSLSLPVKRHGEPALSVKSNENSRNGQSANPSAANSEASGSCSRAPEGEATVAANAGSQSNMDLHCFRSVLEIATNAGHRAMWEDSDADDAHSVSTEPVSRFGSQSERFHSPPTSKGSKVGRVAYPSWESGHGRRSSLDSSVDSNAPLERDSDLFATQGVENLISSSFLENDAFDMIGDAHRVEINSLDVHSGIPKEVNAAGGAHQPGQVRNPEISMAGFLENDIISKPEKSSRNAVFETAPSTMQKGELGNPENPKVEHDVKGSEYRQEDSSAPAVESNAPVAEQEKDAATSLGSRKHEIEMAISSLAVNDVPVASSRNVTDETEAEEGPLLMRKENFEGNKLFDSTLNLVRNEDSCEEGADAQARMKKNIELGIERSATNGSPSHQESPYISGVQLAEKDDPACCSSKDYTITSTHECIERVHFNIDSAPLPHPDMERSLVTPISVDHPDPSATPESTAGELDICSGTSSSPCDELQQDFDVKLRVGQSVSNFGPIHDYNKDGIKKSNLLQSDRSEKVPLLQDGRENENMQLMRRTFPSSILLWCSQLFSAIFGIRSQR